MEPKVAMEMNRDVVPHVWKDRVTTIEMMVDDGNAAFDSACNLERLLFATIQGKGKPELIGGIPGEVGAKYFVSYAVKVTDPDPEGYADIIYSNYEKTWTLQTVQNSPTNKRVVIQTEEKTNGRSQGLGTECLTIDIVNLPGNTWSLTFHKEALSTVADNKAELCCCCQPCASCITESTNRSEGQQFRYFMERYFLLNENSSTADHLANLRKLYNTGAFSTSDYESQIAKIKRQTSN